MFIGDQLEECKDYSGLFYVLPFQKGFLVNWDVEKQIWDYMFGKEVMKVTVMHLSMETPTPPHPGETWGIRQLKGKKEEKAPPCGGKFLV